MKVDARPFRVLVTTQGRCKCLAPKVNPLALGTAEGAMGVIKDAATHTIKAFSPLPPDLTDNATFEVEGKLYRVLRNGMDMRPYGVKLYVRADGPAEQVDA